MLIFENNHPDRVWIKGKKVKKIWILGKLEWEDPCIEEDLLSSNIIYFRTESGSYQAGTKNNVYLQLSGIHNGWHKILFYDKVTTVPSNILGNSNSSIITEIILPSTTLVIEGGAFLGTSITKFNLPSSTNLIIWTSLLNCLKLISIVVDSNNTVYDSRDNCNAIIETSTDTLIIGCKNTTIPDSVESIAYGAFYGISYEKDLILKEGLNIVSGAFLLCNIKKIIFPETFKFVSESSLNNILANSTVDTVEVLCDCNELIICNSSALIKNIIIGRNFTGKLYNTGNFNTLQILDISNSRISNISETLSGTYADTRGVLVSNIQFPSTILNIHSSFCYCSKLLSLDLGVSGDIKTSFNHLNSLKSVNITGANKITDGSFLYNESLESITVNANIIENSSFSYNESLENISVTADVLSSGAFMDCSNLKTAILKVREIKGSIFSGCPNLETLVLEEGCEVIHSGGISGSNNITELNFPNTLKVIKDGGLSSCPIKKIIITENIEELNIGGICQSAVEELEYYATPSTNRYFLNIMPYSGGFTNVRKVIIGEQYTGILGNIFTDSTKLEEISLGSIVEIGENSFNGCENLKSIEIPNTVKSIGSYAFSGCTNLEEVVLSEGLESIGSSAFYGCSSLKLLIIPGTVTSIGSSFIDYGCGVETLIFLEGFTKLENNCHIFASMLNNVLLPSTLTTIGRYTFVECSSLLLINIPSSVITLYESFYMDPEKSLINLYVNWETPIAVLLEDENDVLPESGDYRPTCTLHVPSGTKSLYEAADFWKEFGSIVENENN